MGLRILLFLIGWLFLAEERFSRGDLEEVELKIGLTVGVGLFGVAVTG
jgi:hypothetical protein